MFLKRNILKYNCISPDGKTDNRIDHILIDRRWHSRILDIRSFRNADSDTDHYPVVAKLRESLAVSKQVTQKFVAEKI